MFVQLERTRAAICAAIIGCPSRGVSGLVGCVLAAISLSSCIATAPPLLGADPADPRGEVAGVGYRSTIAPYSSLRPTAPAPWREQNERVAPSKSGQ